MTTQSLKRRTFNSAIWTIVGFGTSKVLQLGSMLILRRLLIPEFFGIQAIMDTIITGVSLFSDVGVAQSIVNHKNGDTKAFLDTAWTVQVIRGFLLWGVVLLATIPAANFYHDPRLLALIPVIGLSSVIDGFHSTRLYVAQRRLELWRFTVYELVSQFLYLTLMVLIAWQAPSVWSLTLGGLGGALIRSVGSYFVFPGHAHRFTWDKEAIADLTSFGRWVFFATATMFVAEQSDRLILAKLTDWRTLGLYTGIFAIANIPRELIKLFSYRVIFPAVANQLDLSRAELRVKVTHQRKKLLILSAVTLAGLAAAGDLVVHLLLPKYVEVSWIMPLLCTGMWFSILYWTMSQVLLAIGKPLYAAQCNMVRFVVVAVGLPVGFHLSGLLGGVIAIAISDFPLYVTNLFALQREKLSCLVQDFQATALFAGCLTGLLVLRYSLGWGLPIDSLRLFHG
jgi:O-antigen/teichoic acid export membrane protein